MKKPKPARKPRRATLLQRRKVAFKIIDALATFSELDDVLGVLSRVATIATYTRNQESANGHPGVFIATPEVGNIIVTVAAELEQVMHDMAADPRMVCEKIWMN